MKNIIDTSDVSCCTHCKKSLENVNPIYQTDDLLFCSKDCLADFVIENEFESLTAAFIGLELVNVTLPPDIDRCTTCKKDLTCLSPIYSDQYCDFFCSQNCIADFYMEDQYNCLRDALIDIGADEGVENDD